VEWSEEACWAAAFAWERNPIGGGHFGDVKGGRGRVSLLSGSIEWVNKKYSIKTY
jgi:hypothetical protein